MDTRKAISRIAAYSFTGALLFYVLVHDQLLAQVTTNPWWAKLIVEFLAALSVYSIAFSVLFSLYARYFFRIFDRRLMMDGDWYQIFAINECDSSLEAIRHGPCRVVSSYEGVTISGESYRANQEFSSSWQSQVSIIIGDRLTLMYVTNGIRRKNSITRGTMSYHISGSPPTRLVGSFADSTPATHSGPITLFRVKSEYEAQLVSLIKLAKERKNTTLLAEALKDESSSI
ncbi:MAG: hypothetical protein Q7T26_03445 [Dehalococcoidia bacterium]|nr:hypothetical protein [Dehalococcoidia bacterium]